MVESGHSATLEHILDAGGDANLADKEGRTPLHVAAKLGDVKAAITLLEHDGNPDAIEKVLPPFLFVVHVCLFPS